MKVMPLVHLLILFQTQAVSKTLIKIIKEQGGSPTSLSDSP